MRLTLALGNSMPEVGSFGASVSVGHGPVNRRSAPPLSRGTRRPAEHMRPSARSLNRRPDRRCTMPPWQVRDVLSTDVVTAGADTSVAEIASLLAGRRISAVPIVDEFDVVVGVVSWTDLRDKLDIGEPDATVHRGWLRRWMPPRVRWPAATAIDVMSAPAVTVRPDASLAAAARLMYQKKVGRL